MHFTSSYVIIQNANYHKLQRSNFIGIYWDNETFVIFSIDLKLIKYFVVLYLYFNKNSPLFKDELSKIDVFLLLFIYRIKMLFLTECIR